LVDVDGDAGVGGQAEEFAHVGDGGGVGGEVHVRSFRWWAPGAPYTNQYTRICGYGQVVETRAGRAASPTSRPARGFAPPSAPAGTARPSAGTRPSRAASPARHPNRTRAGRRDPRVPCWHRR